MTPLRRLSALLLASALPWSRPPLALSQGDHDLQFPQGELRVSEPVSEAGPIVIHLEHLEVYAELGPGPGGRAPMDRLLLTMRVLGEFDRLLAFSQSSSTLRFSALPPGAYAPDDAPVLPLPPHGQPLIPQHLMTQWMSVFEAAGQVDLPTPDNPTGTYWPQRLYTIRVEGTLDRIDARQTLQRLESTCAPPTGWRPEASVDGQNFPMVIRGEGADPLFVEKASADGRSFRVGFGLFSREEDARRMADSLAGCAGRKLKVSSISSSGRTLALVYGPRSKIP